MSYSEDYLKNEEDYLTLEELKEMEARKFNRENGGSKKLRKGGNNRKKKKRKK